MQPLAVSKKALGFYASENDNNFRAFFIAKTKIYDLSLESK